MIPPQWTARAASILLAALGVFLTLCFISYNPADVSLLTSGPQQPMANLGGTIGVWVGFVGRGGFGWASLVLCAICVLWAWRLWTGHLPEVHVVSLLIAGAALVSSIGTIFALTGSDEIVQTNLGGLTGFFLARSGVYYLGLIGTVLMASCVGLLSWLVVSGQTLGTSGLGLLRRLFAQLPFVARRTSDNAIVDARRLKTSAAAAKRDDVADTAANGRPETKGSQPVLAIPRVRIRSMVEPKPKTIPSVPRRQAPGGFQLPSLDLLATPPPISERHVTENLQMNARILEETLREFGVEANVVNIDRGPTVTRYELMPSPGVKLTKIVSLADDLALVMKAASCHIIAPIPGKGCVGIDVPNSSMTMVYLKEIITAHEFTGNPSPLVLPIGKDVSGQAVVTDLRECPHLLIAGATGSGKTVCLNSLLVGILAHASPEQVKFLMIDPKMVEMAMFNEIPHMVAPVVTNAKKAAAALGWAVEEMERRYQLLAAVGVRNVELYNKRVSAPGGTKVVVPAGIDVDGNETPAEEARPLPYLVVVIDELADLMMIASQDVEHAITRLAQLSRAVGIHIILATQRPSVDVITGVLKANFPARIAFQVASKVDSRTILDINGADKLLGRGDLLFLRPGTAKPIRAQGAYLSDAEIEQVTNFLKQQRTPSYDERFLEKARQPEGVAAAGERDELYEMAKQIVLDAGQASTSLLQRRLRLGYGRAARILDLMEQEGLVGPPQGSRPREVLVSRDAIQQGS